MDATFRDVDDELWEQVRHLFPPAPDKPKRGRPRVANRRIFAGIVYRLRTGCQWKAIPDQFAPGSTVHDRFQELVQAGVFEEMFALMVARYQNARGLDLDWCSMDTAMVKAPKGGLKQAQTPRIGRRRAPNAAF